jgi:hypothetical protein
MSTDEIFPGTRKVVLQFLSKALAVCAVALLFVTSLKVGYILGFTHALTILGLGAALTLSFSLADGLRTNKATKFQYLTLTVNVIFLVYLMLMLPTKEAVDLLNQSKVKQNFYEVIFK